ncbi:MAG: hypothetical protein Q8L89_09375 [Gammaproteobacteria bacterium]|nr:hypothetical protein [Gammaproteobacteria bacterium]
MPVPIIVNKFGRLTGWNSITFNFFGRDIEGILEFEYSDSVEWENVYAGGKMPIGEGEGNYAAEASLTVLAEEWRAMQDGIPPGARMQDALGAIICAYEYGTKVYKDVVNNVRVMGQGVGPKQGDKSISVKLELKVSHVNWNV